MIAELARKKSECHSEHTGYSNQYRDTYTITETFIMKNIPLSPDKFSFLKCIYPLPV